jgi:hypothetical protein
MRTPRFVGALLAAGTLAVVPLATSGGAGAQDAGDCGSGGVAAAADQSNTGGLIGSLIPIEAQIILPVNAPILSPNQQTCNANSNSVGGGGGGGGGGAGVAGATGGSGGGVGGATAAVPVSGAGGPRFAG